MKKALAMLLASTTVLSPMTAHAMDVATQNAYNEAHSFITNMAFSKQGLIEQLSSPYGSGFTIDQATNAVNQLEADGQVTWTLEALEDAQSYLSSSAFSDKGLRHQLEYEKFTPEEVNFAVTNCQANWNEQADKAAKSYMESSSFSKDALIHQLEYEGFTHEQAVHGAKSVGF